MIASLGMYDMPHLRAAHDRFWAAIRDAYGRGPDKLTRGKDPWDVWSVPDLILSQTCGLPYRAQLHGHVTLVGTPDYDLPSSPPGHYFSYLIKRKRDARPLKRLVKQGIMAFNDPLSQSGWAAPLAHLQAHGLQPSKTHQTGSHTSSISAVLKGEADYAAIDALTLMLWAAEDPGAMALLDAFDRTEPTPALPYITALGTDPVPLARAIETAIGALSERDRTDLRLRGLIQIPPAAYLAYAIPPAP